MKILLTLVLKNKRTGYRMDHIGNPFLLNISNSDLFSIGITNPGLHIAGSQIFGKVTDK